MPEGHTTHALAERLGRAFSGTVVSVSSPQGRFEDGAALLDALALVGASAWGKHLFVQFEGERWLNVHLGLIGKFSVKRHLVDPGPGAGPDTHPQIPGMPHGHVPVEGQVRLRLLNDTWVGDLRGPTVCAVVTPEKVDEIQARLGPDPLRTDADPDFALRRIMRSTKPIAELLMDQAVLAGVGNVYRCEVLFRHRVDPFRPGREIRPATWQAILDDLTRLMPLGVAFGQGIGYLIVHGEDLAERDSEWHQSGQVVPDGLPGGRPDLPTRAERIDPMTEQHLAPIDVAHSGQHGLVHQQLGNRLGTAHDPT